MNLAAASHWSAGFARAMCDINGCTNVYTSAVNDHLCGQLRTSVFMTALAADGWLRLSSKTICPSCLQDLFNELSGVLSVREDFQALERLRLLTAAVAEMEALWVRVGILDRTDDLRD